MEQNAEQSIERIGRFQHIERIERFQIHKEEFVNKTFRMPKTLVNELSELAHQQGISVNELVTQCCRYSLKNLDANQPKG